MAEAKGGSKKTGEKPAKAKGLGVEGQGDITPRGKSTPVRKALKAEGWE